MSQRAVDTVADERIQRGPDTQREIVPVGKVRQRQRYHCVDRPCVDAPVEEGDAHGLAGSGGRLGRTDRRRGVVHDGLCNAEEHQTDAHAGSEQHGEPGAVAVVRRTVVRAELDAAVTADGDADDEDQEAGHCKDGEPACIIGSP